MSFQIDENENWKKDLILLLAESLCDIESFNKSSAEKVGYYYSCYAPAFLYKYYSDSSLNFETITNNKMWYSAPVHFNDVFDCDLLVNKEEIIECFKELFPDSRGFRVGSQAWREFQSFYQQSLKELEKTLDGIKSTIGISCLSETFDSLLMWAHYANNHSGFCVEYELIKINKELNFTPVPVIYSKDRVSINSISFDGDQNSIMKTFTECLTSKSSEWQYEKEWRIIRDDKACGDRWNNDKNGALLDMIKPRSIILGCMANKELEKRAKAYCEDNQVNLFKMVKDEKLFKLNKYGILIFDDEII